MSRFSSLAIALSAALVPTLLPFSAARGAPVSYFEPIDGDLPSSGPPTVLTLDTGLNTVDGTVTSGTVSTSDFDDFAFVVPAGLEVLSGKVTMTDAAGSFSNAVWELRSGSTTPGVGTFLGNVSVDSPGFAFFPATPLAAGNYNFFNQIVSGDGTSTGNYTFIFDVHPVIPEPASLGVLALAPIAMIRRRRG